MPLRKTIAIDSPKASGDVQAEKYQRRRLESVESLPLLDTHADFYDVIRSAEEDRESAKERKRETEGEG